MCSPRAISSSKAFVIFSQSRCWRASERAAVSQIQAWSLLNRPGARMITMSFCGMQGTFMKVHLVIALLASSQQSVLGRQQLHGRNVKIAVAEIPGEYTKGSVEQLHGFGALGSVVDIQNYMWQPVWHEMDKWWINQMTISPLREWEHQRADIIFVPATLRWAL